MHQALRHSHLSLGSKGNNLAIVAIHGPHFNFVAIVVVHAIACSKISTIPMNGAHFLAQPDMIKNDLCRNADHDFLHNLSISRVVNNAFNRNQMLSGLQRASIIMVLLASTQFRITFVTKKSASPPFVIPGCPMISSRKHTPLSWETQSNSKELHNHVFYGSIFTHILCAMMKGSQMGTHVSNVNTTLCYATGGASVLKRCKSMELATLPTSSSTL